MQGGPGGVEWQCPSCKVWSPIDARVCGNCGKDRPHTALVQGPGRRGIRPAFTTVRPWSLARVLAFFLVFAGLAIVVVGSYTPAFGAVAIFGGGILFSGLLAASYDSGRIRGERHRRRPAPLKPGRETGRVRLGPAGKAGLLVGAAGALLGLAFYFAGPAFLALLLLSLTLFMAATLYGAYTLGLQATGGSDGS